MKTLRPLSTLRYAPGRALACAIILTAACGGEDKKERNDPDVQEIFSIDGRWTATSVSCRSVSSPKPSLVQVDLSEGLFTMIKSYREDGMKCKETQVFARSASSFEEDGASEIERGVFGTTGYRKLVCNPAVGDGAGFRSEGPLNEVSVTYAIDLDVTNGRMTAVLDNFEAGCAQVRLKLER